MPLFRKKPVVITAIKWFGSNYDEIVSMQGSEKRDVDITTDIETGIKSLRIHTLEGDHFADIGDWIIRGVKGELYPCKPDIFDLTYDRVQSQQHNGAIMPTVRSNKRFRTIQYDGKNLEKIQTFIYPNYKTVIATDTFIRIDSLFNDSCFGVDYSNWILQREDEEIFVCTDYVYSHNYEEIPSTEKV